MTGFKGSMKIKSGRGERLILNAFGKFSIRYLFRFHCAFFIMLYSTVIRYEM